MARAAQTGAQIPKKRPVKICVFFTPFYAFYTLKHTPFQTYFLSTANATNKLRKTPNKPPCAKHTFCAFSARRAPAAAAWGAAAPATTHSVRRAAPAPAGSLRTDTTACCAERCRVGRAPHRQPTTQHQHLRYRGPTRNTFARPAHTVYKAFRVKLTIKRPKHPFSALLLVCFGVQKCVLHSLSIFF